MLWAGGTPSTCSAPYVSVYNAKSSTPSTRGVTAAGKGTFSSWSSTAVHESGAICNPRIQAPPQQRGQSLLLNCQPVHMLGERRLRTG